MPETMTREMTEYLLNLYRDKSARPSMKHLIPMEWNGRKWCAATEGHHFILIPENKENKLPAPPDKVVDIAAVIQPFNCDEAVNINLLKKAFESIPMITRPVMAECDSCDGDGKFEHFGEWYDCKTCDEKGEVETNHKETIKDPKKLLQLSKATFGNTYIKTLLTVIQVTSCQQLWIRFQKPTGITIFTLDSDIVIGIAAIREKEEGDETVIVA